MIETFLVLGDYKKHKQIECNIIAGQKVVYDPAAYSVTVHRDNVRYILHLENYLHIAIINLQKGKTCGIWAKDRGYICGEAQINYGNYENILEKENSIGI